PRLLLVDDDASFRAQLETLLADNLPDVEVVGSVADAHSAVAEAMRSSPEIVLIDYAMPGPHGAHAAAVIRQALPGTRVLILSGLDREALVDLPEGVDVIAKGAGLESRLVAALAPQP